MRYLTKKWNHDFQESKDNELWYDLEDDWCLIEPSITTQYGIRIRKEIKDMDYAELCNLIAGLMPETPLRKYCSNKK